MLKVSYSEITRAKIKFNRAQAELKELMDACEHELLEVHLYPLGNRHYISCYRCDYSRTVGMMEALEVAKDMHNLSDREKNRIQSGKKKEIDRDGE